jgi:hypothetical protein
MFKWADTVRLTVGWLDVEHGAEGRIVRVVYLKPVSYLVEFPSGTYVIPATHLERAAPARRRLRAGWLKKGLSAPAARRVTTI